MISDGLRPVPGAPEVARALNGASHPDEVVRVRIAEATTLAQALTAGQGFSADGRRVHPEVADAITASVVRSLDNPSLPLTLVGPPHSPRPGTFDYWTEADLVLMARLRRGVRTAADVARAGRSPSAGS